MARIGTDVETAHEMLLEALIQRFGSIEERIEKRVRAIENKDICKNLLGKILVCQSIQDFKEVLFKSKSVAGKSGLNLQQNYDAVVKWMAQQFKGKTLEIFGVKTEPIIDVFNFEPVEIRVDTLRLDLIFKDKADNLYHLEEQRNMKIDDLHRFGIYHFQAARQWFPKKVTDIILISGRPYNGDKKVKTGSGIYSPNLIDLTEKDGETRLKQIKEEVNAGDYKNVIELVFVPLYGKEKQDQRSRLALEVLEYEVELLKRDKLMDKLVFATIIMSNKIVDKELLKRIYEEVKNMLDILEIAREDGMEKGIQKGIQKGMQRGIQKGMQKGMQSGIQKGKVEMAKILKQDGINISTISKASGLSLQEIKRL